MRDRSDTLVSRRNAPLHLVASSDQREPDWRLMLEQNPWYAHT
jgi:hypothetical protein